MICQREREKQVRDFLWLIDLNKVIRIRDEEEIRRWEQFVEALGHACIQVRIFRAEDDAHGPSERLHLRDHPGPILHSRWEILIQAKESGLCRRRDRKLLIQQG